MRWRKRTTIRGCRTSRWRWTRTRKRWRLFSWWSQTSPWYVRSTVESVFAITVSFWASFTRLTQECEQKRKRERKLNCRYLVAFECTRLLFWRSHRERGGGGGAVEGRLLFFARALKIRFSVHTWLYIRVVLHETRKTLPNIGIGRRVTYLRSL